MFAGVFRRNLIWTASVAVAFVFAGLLASFAILHFARRADSRPPLFMAEMIGEHPPGERAAALAEFHSMRERHGPGPGRDDERGHRFEGPPDGDPLRGPPHGPPHGPPPGPPPGPEAWFFGAGPRPRPQMILLGADGGVIHPEKAKLAFKWAETKLPEGTYEAIQVEGAARQSDPAWLVRLPGAPTQYLLLDGFMGGPPPSPLRALSVTLGCLIGSMLLGIGIALSLLFRSLESKVRSIDAVMAELRAGNLKARVPIAKMDDFGRAMHRFNLMAEEIERLIENLRGSESARTRMLQELAHDLRTPIAALRSAVETLSEPRRLEPGLREELFDISRREVEYLHRLVDDLLALAHVTDPTYRSDQRRVNLREILEEEAAAAEMKRSRDASAPRLDLDLPEDAPDVIGDPHLLRRMIRNAIDNAFDFARGRVRVSLALESDDVAIEVADDGPGLSAEALQNFGERRMTRSLDAHRNGRISIGLGSVIMKAVAEAHRGGVVAQNAASSDGSVGGARIFIRLPKAS